jgi:hypothetical protein
MSGTLLVYPYLKLPPPTPYTKTLPEKWERPLYKSIQPFLMEALELDWYGRTTQQLCEVLEWRVSTPTVLRSCNDLVDQGKILVNTHGAMSGAHIWIAGSEDIEAYNQKCFAYMRGLLEQAKDYNVHAEELVSVLARHNIDVTHFRYNTSVHVTLRDEDISLLLGLLRRLR